VFLLEAGLELLAGAKRNTNTFALKMARAMPDISRQNKSDLVGIKIICYFVTFNTRY
tara:strand:+ start:996 stop:1166 length:171 start_codon:yes stop_codon:yes gene_type:complete